MAELKDTKIPIVTFLVRFGSINSPDVSPKAYQKYYDL